MEKTAIILVKLLKSGREHEFEVPLDISANELVIALNQKSVLNLGINTDDLSQCYLRAEKPIALLRGYDTLEKFGVRNGTTIIIPNR